MSTTQTIETAIGTCKLTAEQAEDFSTDINELTDDLANLEGDIHQTAANVCAIDLRLSNLDSMTIDIKTAAAELRGYASQLDEIARKSTQLSEHLTEFVED